MGVSTDAILFYGYCWDEEGVELFGDTEVEWRELILLKRGHIDPWGGYPSELIASMPSAGQRVASKEWTTNHRAELDAWTAAALAVEKEFGVEPGWHCSGDCPMPYVYVVGSRTRAARGFPEQIKTPLEVQPDWDAKLERFLAEFGIKKPHESPQWWLVSHWG